MIDIDHFMYKNYLIEQETLDKLQIIKIKSNGVLTESATIQLNEDAKDIVMTSIRKIIANIQEVWNKFKTTIVTEVDLKRINQYEKYLNTDYILRIPEGFAIPKIDEYNKMLSENIPAFQENMIEELSDEKEFTRRHFSYFFDDEKSPREVAESKIFKIADSDGKDTTDKEKVTNYIKLIKEFKTNADKIANDIKNLNSSSRSIENLISQSVNAAANISNTYDYYFTEAEEKETFNSINKENEDKQNDKSEEKKEDNSKKEKSDLSKKINTYFKVCNSILSTKLIITNKVRSSCTTIAVQFGKVQADKVKSGNKEGKTEQPKAETKSSSTPIVKI